VALEVVVTPQIAAFPAGSQRTSWCTQPVHRGALRLELAARIVGATQGHRQ
jgi:hypothetical protein